MPYITQQRREAFATLEKEMSFTRVDTPGEMVYLFCRIADLYMSQHLFEFARLNDVIGAFENAKEEFRRKMINDYEDGKEQTNGTVWKQWGLT
jgi:hypothetical protein